MQLSDFIAFHRPALEADEIRHNLLLGIMTRFQGQPELSNLVTWTLGGGEECAVKTPGFSIVLGNLSAPQCKKLAELTRTIDYPGVVGGESALQFAQFASELGVDFSHSISQTLKVLRAAPDAPDVPGHARKATIDDFDLFRDWEHAFIKEAVRHDPVPDDAALRSALESGRYWFWIADKEPVSMAAIGRRTLNSAAINSVFTPPDKRRNGFAGAVTAAVARAIFAEGRSAASLYVDRANPASNRCYEKLGFKDYCESWHFIRSTPAVG